MAAPTEREIEANGLSFETLLADAPRPMTPAQRRDANVDFGWR